MEGGRRVVFHDGCVVAVHFWVRRGCKRITTKSTVNIGWYNMCTENKNKGVMRVGEGRREGAMEAGSSCPLSEGERLQEEYDLSNG